MKTIFFYTFAACLIFANQACNSTKPASHDTTTPVSDGSETLYKNEWRLISLQEQVVPVTSRAFLAFTPGQVNRVAGNAGCNRLSGSFELNANNTIKFSPLAVTKMACAETGLNDVEQKFLDALTAANKWQVADGILSFSANGAVLAKLKVQKPVSKEEAALNGSWELNYISGAKIAFAGLFPGNKPTIVFNFPAEEATGSGGCNGYSIKVKVNGATINFGDALSTMMACEGNGEPVYFKTLKTVTDYSITDDGKTLHLTAAGVEVLRFSRL